MKRKTLIGTSLILLVCFIIGYTIFLKKDAPSEVITTEKVQEDAETGLSFRYTEPLLLEQLSDQDKKDKLVSRLTSINPAMLVTVRYEDGLRAATAATRQEPLQMLVGSADRAFPQRFPGYRKVEERQLTIDDKKAIEIIFTYTGPGGELAKQRLLIILKDDNTAIYISAQAQESDFNKLNSEHFDSIFSTINFN